MKTLATILLLASLALNAAFLTGCVTRATFFGNDVPEDEGRARLVRIADILEIQTAGKSAFDLESDIRHSLESDVDVPRAFDEETLEAIAQASTTQEAEILRNYQRFILRLQGKRILVVGGEE